jgi:signal transduction histidine kinase
MIFVFFIVFALTVLALILGSHRKVFRVRIELIVGLAVVVLLTLSALRVLSPLFGVGVLVGVILVIIVREARTLIRPRRPYTLRTSLYRAVFVTLLALFAVVMLGLWRSDRQTSHDLFFASSDEATAQLNLAYHDQPVVWGSSHGPEGLDIGGRGLWFDAATYLRIRRLIDRMNDGQTINGEMLLNGADSPSLRQLVPPALADDKKAMNRIGISSDSFPDMMLPALPSTATDKQSRERLRAVGDYIRAHGSKIGKTSPEWGAGDYAIWRTGANTAYFVGVGSPQAESWYFRPIQLGFQGIFIYALLAPFAAVAAWYLNRRLVRPVEQVAAASVALADGRLPEPIPEREPAELATLAASFNRMSAKLRQAEAAEQQFLQSVSHELKTPLTAIEGYAELLGEGDVSPDVAAQVVTAESGRLRRLVADLIDLGKMRQSTFAVRREAVDLRRVADEVARRYAQRARDYGVELTVVRDGQPAMDAAAERGEANETDPARGWLVAGDEDRVVQVLNNLVENAVRCTPGDGQVTIAVSPGRLSVRDTGPGLESLDLEHAFERFYLYDRCRAGRPVGTGLGLAIVRELTEAMGGTVRAESVAGKGSTFTVELPLESPLEAPLESPLESPRLDAHERSPNAGS